MAVNVTLAPAQAVLPGFAVTLIVGVTVGFTVMVIVLLVCVAFTTQGGLPTSVQVTWSPFTRLAVVYEAALPTGKPFTFHVYDGLGPPFVIVDVNVTDCPVHITLPGLADMLIVGVKLGFTVMVIVLLLTVTGVAHVALLVSTHTTWSLLFSVLVV